MGKLTALATLIILIILSLLVGCSSPEPEMNTQLKVTPSKTIVGQGEAFTVEIEVVPGIGVNIAGVQLNILFSQESLRIDSVQEGNLLNQGGAQTYFQGGTVGPTSVVNMAGVIIGPGQNVTAPGVFAILNCIALKGGRTSAFQLENVIVGDKDANSLPLELPVILQVTVAALYDINLDGLVGSGDLSLVYQALGNTGGREDVKGDGIVNVLDMILVAQNIV